MGGKEKMRAEKGQSWSIDVIIGVIIFMLIIAVLYATLTSRGEDDTDSLQQDARVVASKLRSDEGIIADGIIDKSKLDDLCNRPYDEVKAELNIEHDFCIYIEDQNGNLIPCGAINRSGIGNGADINLTKDIVCGQSIG